MPRRTVRPHTGMTLIFVIAMLALMSVLSVSFAGMAQLERQLGGNYVFHVRARLAAESGMAWAHARLMELAPNAVNDVSAIAALAGDAGVASSFSRVVEESGAARGGFTVTVDDESAKLNLNSQSGAGLWEAARIVLETVVGRERAQTAITGLCDDPASGRAAHPGGRFPDWEAVAAALRQAGLGEDEITAARHYLTVDSWMDPDVIGFDAPTYRGGRYSEIARETEAPLEMELCVTHREFNARDLERAPRAPVNVNAAPVELLQALIQPLCGVFLDERGRGPESKSTDHYGWATFGDEGLAYQGVWRRTALFTQDQAQRLARAIHDRVHGVANGDLAVAAEGAGNRLETWDEFQEFLEHELTAEAWQAIFVGESGRVREWEDVVTPRCQMPDYRDPHAMLNPIGGDSDADYDGFFRNVSGALWSVDGLFQTSWDTSGVVAWWDGYYGRSRMDLVLAAMNPNTRLNDFNPNANLYLMVDKPQIIVGTTEFCFDSTGVFSVVSRGACERREAVPEADAARGLARHGIQAVIRVFAIHRLTTEAQFLRGIENSEVNGPITAAAYFSEAASYFHPMYGSGTVDVAMGPGGRFALQAYPQPLLAGRETDAAAVFQDGMLMPATLETRRQSSWSSKSFLCHFNGDGGEPLDPDHVSAPNAGTGRQWHESEHNRIHSEPLWVAAGAGGAVYPDGVYCEAGQVYAVKMLHFYDPSKPQFQGKIGNLTFWIKPNFHTGIPTAIRKIVTGPSRPGHYAGQQMAALYYLPNAASNEAIGTASPGASSDSDPRLKRAFHARVNYSWGPMYHSWGGRNYWVPTRSLVFGFAWQRPGISPSDYRNTFLMGMIASPTLTQDYPLANNLNTVGSASVFDALHKYAMPGRQWTLLQASWNVSSGSIYQRPAMGVGFSDCQSSSGNLNRGRQYHPYRANVVNPAATGNWNFMQEWLRFGELPQEDAESAAGSRYYADATIDEIHGRSDWSTTPWTAFSTGSLAAIGRYACLQVAAPMATNYVAWYQTPATDICRDLSVQAGAARLRSVAWTLYRPRNNRDPVSGLCNTVKSLTINPDDEPDPTQHLWGMMPLHPAWDPISVDFREAGANAGSWYFQDRDQWTSRLTYPGGSVPPAGAPVEYRAGDVFQLKVYFHYDEPARRVYEPPVLDDITCTFALSRAEILRWREE